LLINFFIYSYSLICVGYIVIKQQYILHVNATTAKKLVPTYNGILSSIQQVFQELVEKYYGIGKFFWDLVEGQEKNTVKLARIGAAVDTW